MDVHFDMHTQFDHADCELRYAAMRELAKRQFLETDDDTIGKALAVLGATENSALSLLMASTDSTADLIHTAAVLQLMTIAEERRLAILAESKPGP